MLPKEEYINLLASLFQRGLCLNMVDIDGKQNDLDISDEERFSFMAADEALDRVDLDDLFDNAETLLIPEKYPEFYEYLRELQLERQEDGHGERTIEDTLDEEVEENEEGPDVEEPQSLSTKDQVLKNIVDGEHTGNQRDSEKYRKGDEMRAGLDEERREALERDYEQERYDNAQHTAIEPNFEDERREAAARAEEQQRQMESLKQRKLAGKAEKNVNVGSIHKKNAENTVNREGPDKVNEGANKIHLKTAQKNRRSQTDDKDGVANMPSISKQFRSEDSADYSYPLRSGNEEHYSELPLDEDTQNGYNLREDMGEDSGFPYTSSNFNTVVFKQKDNVPERLSGHEELNAKSAQDVSHVIKGERNEGYQDNAKLEKQNKNSLDKEKEAISLSKSLYKNTSKATTSEPVTDELKNKYILDSYEESGQRENEHLTKEDLSGETKSYYKQEYQKKVELTNGAEKNTNENKAHESLINIKKNTEQKSVQKEEKDNVIGNKEIRQSLNQKKSTYPGNAVNKNLVSSRSDMSQNPAKVSSEHTASTRIATAMAMKEAAKSSTDVAKAAVDNAEGMMMLKDSSAISASELASYAIATNKAQEAMQISGKQIADSYSLAGQADAQTIKMGIEKSLSNAREISTGTSVTSGLPVANSIKDFGISASNIRPQNVSSIVRNSNYTDVGIFVLKEGNQVTISRNGKSKKYTVRSNGTIHVDGIVLNVYSVDKNRAFVGWKNAAVYGGKIYTATGTTLDVSDDGNIGTTKTLAGINFHIKREAKVNATPMTMAMSMAPALGKPLTDADFVRDGDKFISNKVTEAYSGLLYQKALTGDRRSQLIFKQKMVMHSIFRAQVLAGAAANMKGIDAKLDLNTLVANYDKILASNCGSTAQFYKMNAFLEQKYLNNIEIQHIADAKAKLKQLGLTENTDDLKDLLAQGGLSSEKAKAITDYLNIYENTREKIIREGVLGNQGTGDLRVERAFYAASLPYVLKARGLPTDKKALKKLLKAKTTSKETKELIRNVLKFQRKLFLINFTETTLKAYAQGAVKAAKNGYRKMKSFANRYMGDDYTMRGLLMMESIFVGTAAKAHRTAKKIKWIRENSGKFVNASIRLGRAGKNVAVSGFRGAKAGVHTAHMGGRAAMRGFSYLRKNGLKKTLKKGTKKLRIKGKKAARKGVLKAARAIQKVTIKAIQAAVKLIQTLISALIAALGPIIVAVIIVLAIILCIIAYVKSSGDEVYYDAGDEETAAVLQEMVDVLTLCHNSFRSELSSRFGGTSSIGSASGAIGSSKDAPQMKKGDSSKVEGLYDVTMGTWWNDEGDIDSIPWSDGCRQLYEKIKNEYSLQGSGGYATIKINNQTVFVAAFGTYWGNDGDIIKVKFNKPIALGNEPASDEIYILKFDTKDWHDTGYPGEPEGIYGHHMPKGAHTRDFIEFLEKDGTAENMNGKQKGYMPLEATNMGSILDGSFDASTIGSGAAASSVSVNADILYRQEIDQDVYRDIIDQDKNVYYTFPEEQKVPDGITPTPTPVGYIKEEAKGEVYGFYNNDQELISMAMAMFDFETSPSTSTKSTIISKTDASGYDEAKTNDTYQKGMTSKEVDDKWRLIEYLNGKGLDLTNYKAGGYDDLRYSTLIGLFNASHIITGTAVKQYHVGPDGTINPTYNEDGRIIGQNNTDGMSYQVPVMVTKTRQVTNADGSITQESYVGYKTDADGNIVYETRYKPCPGHTKYSGAVITLHFDSLLNMKEWWQKNIYDVDDFDKENPNYSSTDASSDTYRAKENVLKRTIQYIKKPDYYKSLDGTCSESENSTTDNSIRGSFDPGKCTESQKEVAKTVYKFLTEEMNPRLTSEQAIGLLVNIMNECSFDYTESDGIGYGLIQWSDTADCSRKTDLIQWCNAHGYKYNTLEGQLKRIESEFTTDTKYWGLGKPDGFLACTDAHSATLYYLDNNEKPAGVYRDRRVASIDADIIAVKALLQ